MNPLYALFSRFRKTKVAEPVVVTPEVTYIKRKRQTFKPTDTLHLYATDKKFTGVRGEKFALLRDGMTIAAYIEAGGDTHHVSVFVGAGVITRAVNV